MNVDAVFIDDDDLMHLVWSQDAEKCNINLKCYKDPDTFLYEQSQYEKTVLVFIDSNLKLNKKGEDYAKDIFDAGFTNIYLASGYSDINIKDYPWIKEVVGKRPTFGDI
jgi:FixJ family two-component response regulator